MFRANSCQQETMFFFTTRDLSQIQESTLLGPQVILPLPLKSYHCKHVGWPLAGPRVQNGHLPPGKAATINSHPASLCSVAASFDSEKIVEQPPSLSDLSLKSTKRKPPRAEELDTGSASLESNSSTLRLSLLRAANSLDG